MDCFQALNKGHTLLTPNQRLATYWRSQYDQWQLSQGLQTWPTADILSMNAWLNRCWQQLACRDPELKQLLNNQQTIVLWQQVITDSPQGAGLLNIQNTASSAIQAWTLANAWRLDIDDAEFDHHQDTLVWQAWAKAFRQRCQSLSVIDSACLEQALIEQAIRYQQPILLYAFNELTPAQQALFDQLQQSGTQIDTLPQPSNKQQQFKQVFHDTQQELQHMVSWAYQQWQAGKQAIACVIPELHHYHKTIKRLCQQQFDEKDLVNISFGEPLSQQAMIDCALTILSMPQQWIPISSVQLLMHTPFIAASEKEFYRRSQLLANCYDLGESIIARTQLQQLAEKTTPQWQQMLQHPVFDQPQYPSQWVKTFSQQLSAFGWPGNRSLSSEEYQLINHWQQVMQQFASIDLIDQPLTRQAAIECLKQCCDQHLFQAHSDQRPIQFLGLFEAAGMPFDAIWCQASDDRLWPPAAKPNPYLPLSIQRQRNMPHASAARELTFSQRLFEQLTQSAPLVIASFAEINDEQECRPCDFIETFECLDTPDIEPNIFQPTTLDTLTETHVTLGDNETIKGGSFILKQQAACPFRAFAQCRLQAESIAPLTPGLSALERGNVLHQVLEIVWRQVKTQQQLLVTDQQSLITLIKQAIETSLEQLAGDRVLTINHTFKDIEIQRLANIILAWLEQEKQRPAFKVIACESKLETTIAGQRLQLRIDRIDQTEQDEIIIIDYKTGQVSINQWFGDRIDEPQLPLYAISQTAHAISYAQIKAVSQSFKGISEHELQIPGISCEQDWPDQLNHWQRDLENTMQEFLDGNTQIAPKYGASTCQQCGLASLCRISEKNHDQDN